MDLNDPFGRAARRREQAYAEFTAQLARNGIDSPQALAGFRARINRMLGVVAGVVLVSALALSLLFPGAFFVVIVALVLLGAWLAANYAQTRGFIRRYEQQLARRREDAAPSSHPIDAEEAP
jgi:hypothetical protein